MAKSKNKLAHCVSFIFIMLTRILTQITQNDGKVLLKLKLTRLCLILYPFMF